MTLQLVHAPVDMDAFHRWSRERGLMRGRSFDAGYALHILLSGMFGKAVLQPFRLFASERRRDAGLYAYTDTDREALSSIAAAAAPPDCVAVLDPASLRAKDTDGNYLAVCRAPEAAENGLRLDALGNLISITVLSPCPFGSQRVSVSGSTFASGRCDEPKWMSRIHLRARDCRRDLRLMPSGSVLGTGGQLARTQHPASRSMRSGWVNAVARRSASGIAALRRFDWTERLEATVPARRVRTRLSTAS